MNDEHANDANRHPRGYYRVTGATLMGLGGLGLTLAMTLVLAINADLGFIDGQSMAAIASLMFLTGLWMYSFGGKDT